MLTPFTAALAAVTVASMARPVPGRTGAWGKLEPVPMPGASLLLLTAPSFVSLSAGPTTRRSIEAAPWGPRGAESAMTRFVGAALASRPRDVRATPLGTLPMVGLVAGLAGLATGSVLWLRASPAPATYGGLEVNPHILRIGAEEAVVGLRGKW